MNRITRAVAFASALAAVLFASYFQRAVFPSFVFLCAGAFVVAAILARMSTRAAAAAVLPFVYATPAIVLAATGQHQYAAVMLWVAALLGVFAGSSIERGWSLPSTWRGPMVLWALIVALSWPVIAAREVDFRMAGLWNDRLGVAGVRISGAGAACWSALAAATHLTGLLFIDWLYGTYGTRGRRRFVPEIAVPLALALAAACCVGAYQAFADVTFLSGHNWPSLHRATGSFMDANVFGMIAALWAPAFLLLAVRGTSAFATRVAPLGFALSGLGVWTSGSRTAFLAACVGVALAVPALIASIQSARARLRVVVTTGAGLALVVLLLAAMPSVTATALSRGQHLLPSFSLTSLRWVAKVLWVRDGYGPAALAMIREHPLTGVGVGSYYTLVHDYALATARVSIPPDNAQNWFRHELAELGAIGSIGWIGWVAIFGATLWSRRERWRRPEAILWGPLLAFGLASLVGMPGQDAAVVITFWLLVFWCIEGDEPEPANARQIPKAAWIAMCLLAAGYAVAQGMTSELRPPVRAARFGFPYTYGMDFEQPNQVWTTRHGVTVLNAPQPWLKLTLWVNHPDARAKPVKVDVWRDSDPVVTERVSLNQRIVRYVPVEAGKRFVLEAEVDRTFRPSDSGGSTDHRDLGVAMQWEFVPMLPK
jgi:hypothetical protein